MTSILPITLNGDTLGKRHKQINTLVKKSYDNNEDFMKLQHVPEISPVDRLFKIDLASKHRDVEYILKNLKNDDMLYVCRVLQAKWLLESKYEDIINPAYLENNLYPYMITTAVTKMKHWIHLNLRDEHRSGKFYEFYKEKDFELAMKFLVKSLPNFVEAEFPKIVHVISPKHFKLLSEKNTQCCKLFYDLISSDETLKSRYLENEGSYYESIKCVFKYDTNLFLNITEKYFNTDKFRRFSSITTKFIMKHHKDRFFKKRELYTAWILDIATLAESLNEDEAKYLVIKLARAKYLQGWFTYQSVEPLIKRLKPQNRAAFKKKVFVDKDIGDVIYQWPYQPPSAPQTEDLGPDIFKDSKHDPSKYERLDPFYSTMLKKKKYALYCCSDFVHSAPCVTKVKTELDKLFDEFRFVSFDKTFYDLNRRIAAESSSQIRQYIMLVLVSKTGGRADAINTLMGLLARHRNEPSNLRAAIIRSLVKRAVVWRLPEETWKQLLEFGQGLGLDGNSTETECVEGLHSVFIRMLLNDNVETKIFKSYLNNFSDLSNYQLSTQEKIKVSEALPKLLLSAVKAETVVDDAVVLINKLIGLLKASHVKVDTYPGLIPAIVDLASQNQSSTNSLLKKIFDERIGRKYLLNFTYKLINTDASHINALKHDSSVLDFEYFYESCLNSNKFEKFLRKIAVYFSEDAGLANQYRKKLKEKEHNKLFGRPLAILFGGEFLSYINDVDKENQIESKVFAAILRANAHMVRPFVDLDSFGWRKAGVKMIANKLMICPLVDVGSNVEKLIQSKETARLAFVLSIRNESVNDVFLEIAKLRPALGIKLGLKLIREQNNSYDENVWLTIKPFIEQFNFENNTKTVYIKKLICNADAVPTKIRPEYCVLLYKAFDKLKTNERFVRLQYLCRLEYLLPDVDESFIEEVMKKQLDELNPEKINCNYNDIEDTCLLIRVIFTYIYHSKSEETAKRRFEIFGTRLLSKLTEIYKTQAKEKIFFKLLSQTLRNFKNTNIFMCPDYVSCLYVMEHTVTWMKTILPMEQHFDKYVLLHLTMLYYKTIRQTVTEVPEVFETEVRKHKDAVKIVGNIFGKYIAKEVKELMTNYFDSIIFLYKDVLLEYVGSYFNHTYSSDFLSSIIKGILDMDPVTAPLALFVLKEKYYTIGEEISDEISKHFYTDKVLENKINKFFAFAELD